MDRYKTPESVRNRQVILIASDLSRLSWRRRACLGERLKTIREAFNKAVNDLPS
jgi:hypothetical protein